MLEKINDLPYGIVGINAVGHVSRQDYEAVFEPLLHEARRDGRRMRFLYQFGPSFEGVTVGGAWEELKIGLSAMKSFEGCAIVTDIGWIREASRPIGFLLPCPVRVFANNDRAVASEWLHSLPVGSSVSHHLFRETGVVVIEIKRALHAFDFDALILSVDTWLEAEGPLPGLVFRVREFPGWNKLGNFLHHLRFVHDYHHKVRRIALASDSKLAVYAPRLAKHFTAAEVKTFDYDAVELAVKWAGTADDTLTSVAPRSATAPSSDELAASPSHAGEP
jgi:hypothetical protein